MMISRSLLSTNALLIALSIGCASSAVVRPGSLPIELDLVPADSMQALPCPLPARPVLPARPDFVSGWFLAKRASQHCSESCTANEQLAVHFSIQPSGVIRDLAIVRPTDTCLQSEEVLACVAAVLKQLCFEPSEHGLDAAVWPLDRLSEKLIEEPIPIYSGRAALPVTRIAPRMHVIGTVVLLFDIDPSGRVRNARVAESADAKTNKSALKALRNWRYRPALDPEGRAVWMKAQHIRFNFKVGSRD